MNKISSLLPWILSGAAIGAGSVAFAAEPVVAPNAVAAPSPAIASSAPVTSGQIWECTTNGLRTFSNNPCGTKSAIRELNPINRMDAAPVARANYRYAPQPMSQPQYSNPDAQEPVDASYAGPDRIILVGRVRHQNVNTFHGYRRPHPQHK
jgi:hypothetical protein